MMKWLLVPIAFLCAAISFPMMPFKDHAFPRVEKLDPTTFPRIWEPGQWFHDMKNLWVELYDADPQWWAKWSAHVICLLVLAVLYLGLR